MATGRMPADTSVSCPHPRPKFRARARARRPPRAASSARAHYPRASLARGHARVPARGGEYPRRGGRSRGGEPLPAPPMAIPLAAAARPGATSPPTPPPRRRPVQGQRGPPAAARPGRRVPRGGVEEGAGGADGPGGARRGPLRWGHDRAPGEGGSRTRGAGSWGRRGAGLGAGAREGAGMAAGPLGAWDWTGTGSPEE